MLQLRLLQHRLRLSLNRLSLAGVHQQRLARLAIANGKAFTAAWLRRCRWRSTSSLATSLYCTYIMNIPTPLRTLQRPRGVCGPVQDARSIIDHVDHLTRSG